ncbi:SagB/ThcOx family dehydrogenase [Microcoleus sp. F4-D5]|uniref:SagB/ThcOx family dehydrogenase n=1 Tax=Microcoleus sp. F4-D5 TaxID=2818760 RepID=UPI002FD31FC4
MPELPLSFAQHYHERTKYDPETIAAKSKRLDWTEQPVPFKEYKIGACFDLKPYLKDLSEESEATADDRWWQRLSSLLLCSYGLTAKVQTLDDSYLYLRSAPSAGGLYPAEVYLISRGTGQLPAGLYNYQCRTHSLVHFWDSQVWQALQAACFQSPALENTQLAIAITTVFFRSSWRYEDRAYRRIFLDTGHLLSNIELACAINDYRPHLIGGFADEALNQLLYIDSEQEGAICLVALADLLDIDQNLPKFKTALPGKTTTDYPQLSEGQLLAYLHKATELESDTTGSDGWKFDESEGELDDKYNFPFCTKVSTVTPSIPWGVNLEDLGNTMLKRRSTRAYTGASLSLGELLALLDFTYQPQHYIDQGLDAYPDYFDLSLIETFIAVSGVNGLEEGCYYYAPKAQELRQIRFKNFRRELHYLCLGQDLGRDAAALLFHTADLNRAVGKYGDRVYRYLHMDAGHLGQRLNLAAIQLRLGVSGIAGFFDDRVNEVLGIPASEAVLYITTLGRPRS